MLALFADTDLAVQKNALASLRQDWRCWLQLKAKSTGNAFLERASKMSPLAHP